MHSVSAVESHKIMHWRWDKLSATRDLHVGVGVRDDGVPARINNLPIHARVMTAFFVEDRERARLSQVTITSTRDGRRENWTAILQEVSPLFLQIDFDGSFRAQQRACKEE
jgi:hypothetical protein